MKSLSKANIFGKRLSARESGSCPVCAKKGCTQWSGGAVNCTSYRQGMKGEVVGGYEFIKTDAVGLGLFKPHAPEGDERIANLDSRVLIESRKKLKAQEAEREAAELKKAAEKFSVDKRDSQLRAWAFQKGIHPSQRKEVLLDRGVPDAAINEIEANGLCFTAGWGDNPEHDQLPGAWDKTGRDGKQRAGYGGAPGLAIVCQQYVKGKDGEGDEEVFLGAQIATSKKFRAKGGPKYPWLSTPERSSNVPTLDGGNPITVHRTGEKASHVVICEGILKPLVAFHRQADHGIDLGAAIIGAAGTFWGEPKTFNQIKTQCALLGVREIHLALDAGATQNHSVMMGVAKFAKACFNSGYLLKIIWYGQFEKGEGDSDYAKGYADIDELIVPISYGLLDLGELQELEKEAARLRPGFDEGKVESSLNAPDPFTATKGFKRDFGYLPDHLGELTETVLTHKITCIRAGKGTGKSQLAKRIVEIVHEQNRPVYLIVHRLRLGESLGSLFGLPLKYEVKTMGDYLGYAITADSAHPKSGMRFDGRNIPSNSFLILDEVDQVFWHMVFSRTAIQAHRDEIIEHVGAAMHRAENILALSADLSDRESDLIQATAGASSSDVVKIHNTHQRDLGQVWRYNESYEVIHEMGQCLERGGRFMAKLSGQKESSITGTQTLSAWLRATYPEKSGVVFDSETLKTLSVEAETETGKREMGVLEYLSPPSATLKKERQAEYFGNLDWVLFTSACSTGISFEEGAFTDFFQIEQGQGSVFDAMQATARYRPTNIRRHIFVAPRGMDTRGNGATSPNKLSAGKDMAWARQVMAVADAGCEWLNFEPLEYLSPVGRLWSNYATVRACEYNEQAYKYAECFFDGLSAEGYKVSVGFSGSWAGMSAKEKKEFRELLRSVRDANFDRRNKEQAAEDVSDADLQKLSKKRELSEVEERQLKKLRVMERYGLAADEVTAEAIAADKSGLYQRLLMRLYVEQGLEAAAKVDKARMADALDKGRMWSEDLMSKSAAHRVGLLEEIAVPALLAHLKRPDEEGHLNTITKLSPVVQEVMRRAVLLRGDIKQSLGSTVGKVTTLFLGDGKTEEVIDIARPIAIIQTLLKKMNYTVRSVGQTTVGGERVHKFRLVDLLAEDKASGIAYKDFVDSRTKADAVFIANEPKSPIFSPLDPVTACTLDPNRSYRDSQNVQKASVERFQGEGDFSYSSRSSQGEGAQTPEQSHHSPSDEELSFAVPENASRSALFERSKFSF